ncbi:hypothetical protein A33Q_3594 [Indibacter alkaliphilus LW1]|jgi:integral membrane protein|uniref:DUF3817 domain-containing protein n=1 Tax=Indibacter alkaliphilus (strain CCUG 57479 / KCTC 22604 / LW1) TaxID=1189612 RepID=S2DUZ3_INDAL|nr:DUF3817 domain-containing protein [Indibacter alkaliphilus]EOZ93648.1 hypothetical protein A33Q_3594 [Indibacter alkaliphilus LW1]
MTQQTEKAIWLKRFKIISIIEGISFLLLLFVAMPMKYMLDMPLAVTYVGWAHGVLFVIYIYIVFPTAKKVGWDFTKTLFALIASVLPFGPFIFDRYLTKKEKEMASS